MTDNPRQLFKRFGPLLPAMILYALLADRLQFTQDDAYISYRYVANFLNGDGLVFNIGEKVEGFTNFGWTIYMILAGVLGASYIFVSKLTGFILGAGVIGLTFVLARRLFGDQSFWSVTLACLLTGGNMSLAYWGLAGLETAAFAYFALWAVLLYLRRSWMLIFALTMAVWLRPEGAVVTGLLLVVEAVQNRTWPKFTIICAAIAFCLSLPMVGFKLAYYGSILPNPFFAKTSFTADQLTNGIEYTGRFLRHYGFYYVGGLTLLLPLFVRRWFNRDMMALWLFSVGYLLYITLIGGDVLKVHRFFLPVIGALALFQVGVVRGVVGEMSKSLRMIIAIALAVVMLALTYELPRAFVERYHASEIAFTHKMAYKANQMLRDDSTNFSVAVATIGVFGYELLGHEIIDMVGLTDSTIARYSEDPIPGMETTWKEQKHNSRYILERAPDYIMFSTGIKPSAPAERALLLYRQFMDSYRTVGWYFQQPGSNRGVISSVFKKVRPIEGEIVPVYPVAYVQEYKTALDAHSKNDHQTAIKFYDRAARASPQPYYVYLIYQKAFSLMMLGNHEEAMRLMNAVLARDSMVFEPHMDLYRYAAFNRDTAGMNLHSRWLKRLVPWYWPRIDSTTQSLIRQSGQVSR